MGKVTIKKALGISLAVLFLASLTAAAVSAEASASASCDLTKRTVSATGCTYTIKCSSEDSEGDGYSWNFGDGKKSTSENPSHKYKIAPKCTKHIVRLTVSDSTDDTSDTDSVTI